MINKDASISCTYIGRVLGILRLCVGWGNATVHPGSAIGYRLWSECCIHVENTLGHSFLSESCHMLNCPSCWDLSYSYVCAPAHIKSPLDRTGHLVDNRSC